MAFMNAIAEIDKAGRIVVPKKLRDALHLTAGSRLSLRQEGDQIIVESADKPRGLYMKRGTLVFDPGPVPMMPNRDWVAEDREARIRSFFPHTSKP